MFKLAQSFYRSVLPAVAKPLYILWNEVIGFIFIVFAIASGSAGWKYYRAIHTDSDNFFRLFLTVGFAVLMGSFGLSSFLKARRIRRSGVQSQA